MIKAFTIPAKDTSPRQRIPRACLLLLACLPLGASAEPVRIVTSSFPIFCLVREVVGDAARVENLLAPGTDAHDFQLTRRERERLDHAQLIVVNGLGMEPWLQSAIHASSPPGKIIVAAAGLGRLPSGQTNPHVWLDPVLACGMVSNILAGLCAAEPAQAARYTVGAAALTTRLQSLHEEIRTALLPFRGSALVTQHDAFAHFARRYELKVAGVLEEIPGVGPSPRHLSRLREAAETCQVRAIFIEPRSASSLARQFAKDLGLVLATLDTLENGGPEAGAYEAGMRRNVRTLQQFLSPPPPAKKG